MDSKIGIIHATAELDVTGFAKGLVGIQKNVADMDVHMRKAMTSTMATEQAVGKAGQAIQKHTKNLQGNAGATANLVSQFNDIAVMMAAGQNPLQLAMQQGTQISQVLTQMGGGVGALKALGAAFIGMLNPISLGTIAVIGFGAAAVNWLMPAGEKAAKVKDSFEALKDSMSGYNNAFGVSLLYTGKAEEEYGTEAKKGAELARRIMVREAQKTGDAVKDILTKSYSNLGFESFGKNDIAANRKFDTASLSEVANILQLPTTWGDTFTGVGGQNTENIALVRQLGEAYRDLFAIVSQKPDVSEIDQWLTDVRTQIDLVNEQIQSTKDAGADASVIEEQTAKLTELQTALLVAEKERADIRAADEAKALEMLATMYHQAEMIELINQHGQDSLIVQQAQLDAEYAKQIAAIDTLNITDEQRYALYDAAAATYDAESATLSWADAMAQVNAQLAAAMSLISSIGGGMIMNAKINAAKAVAKAGGDVIERRKAGEIAGKKQEILNGQNTVGSQYFGMSDAMLQGHLNQVDINAAQQEEYTALITPERSGGGGRRKGSGGGGRRKGGGGGRGGKSEAERQAEREERAVERLNEKLETLNATKNMSAEEERIWTAQREAGVLGNKAGEEAIRNIVNQTIELEKLKEATKESEAAFERMGDSLYSVFESIVTGAESAKEALLGLLQQMANNMLRNGFNSWWGGLAESGAAGGGGWLGAIANLTFGKHANGGRIASDIQLVGENGPEIVSLARNSKVYTNAETRNLLSNANANGQGGKIPYIMIGEGTQLAWMDQANANAVNASKATVTSYDRQGAPNRMTKFNNNPRLRG